MGRAVVLCKRVRVTAPHSWEVLCLSADECGCLLAHYRALLCYSVAECEWLLLWCSEGELGWLMHTAGQCCVVVQASVSDGPDYC